MALHQGAPLSESLCADFLQGHSSDVGEETQDHLHLLS